MARLSAEARRAQLLDAATRAFAEFGYRGATTKSIAAEAAVAEALIYRYFRSKEELFIAVVDRTASRLVHATEAALKVNAGNPVRALGSLLDFARAILDTNETLARMVFIVNAELHQASIRAAYRPHQEAVLDLIVDAFEDWQRSGLVPSRLPGRATAWMLLGTFQAIALMKLTDDLGELAAIPSDVIVARILGIQPG
ncbi:MAG: AcrR family transcriptional regulator [Bradymonadia bacterium]|jgi:AcrR family transcriptional regulator